MASLLLTASEKIDHLKVMQPIAKFTLDITELAALIATQVTRYIVIIHALVNTAIKIGSIQNSGRQYKLALELSKNDDSTLVGEQGYIFRYGGVVK